MQAAQIDKIGHLACRDVPIPDLGAGEARIRVRAGGICGTDIAIVAGTLPTPRPLILGHEVAGIVDKVGQGVKKTWTGVPVTTEINRFACRKCFFCLHDMPTQCIHRKAIGIDIDGGFAEYVITDASLLHKIPPKLDFMAATFIEPLAAAIETYKLMPLGDLDQTIAIFGPGKLGLLILQVTKALYPGRTVIMVGRTEFRRKLAEQFGANVVIDAGVKNPVEEIRHLTDGLGADVVVEATGNPEVMDGAVRACRTRGKLAVKSTHGVPTPVNLTEVVVREITIFSSRCGPFEEAIPLLRDEKVDVRPMISKVFSLSEVEKAFAFLAKKGDYIKVGLKIGD
jgi:alcohol dehydrogenase